MLPVLELALKDVSHHAGITRVAEISGGLQATQMYNQCLRTRDPALRDRLFDYNREDIDGLVQVIEYLRRLVEPSDTQPYQLIPAAEVIDLAFERPIRPLAPSPVARRPDAPRPQNIVPSPRM